MAKRTVTQHTCDRCNRTYDETDPAKENATNQPPAIVIEYDQPASDANSAFRSTVKFDDLCPKCSGRVADLVKAIRLDEEKPGDKENAKPTVKTDGSPAAQDKQKPLDPGEKKPDNKTPPETKASDAKVKP